jgi:hypothetical protein
MKFIGNALILVFLLPLQGTPWGAKTPYPRMAPLSRSSGT